MQLPRKRCLLLHNSSRLLLTSFLLKISPSFPLSLLSIVHRTVLCLTRPRTCTCTHTYYPLSYYTISTGVECFTSMSTSADFGNRNSDRDVHAQRKGRFVIGARGGHVAYATEI